MALIQASFNVIKRSFTVRCVATKTRLLTLLSFCGHRSLTGSGVWRLFAGLICLQHEKRRSTYLIFNNKNKCPPSVVRLSVVEMDSMELFLDQFKPSGEAVSNLCLYSFTSVWSFDSQHSSLKYNVMLMSDNTYTTKEDQTLLFLLKSAHVWSAEHETLHFIAFFT